MTKTKPTLKKRKEPTPSFSKKRIKKTSSKLTQKRGVHSKFSKKRGIHSKLTEKESFRKYLAKIESPDYPWVAKGCPENATSSEKAKYELCQKILGYQEDNDLSDQEISRRLRINKEKTLQILFC